MGARPTRPIQLQPTWTAAYKDGLIHIIDSEGKLEWTLSDDIDPMLHHWQEENGHFRRELENWQKFRDIQQKFKHLDRLETQLELGSAVAVSITALTRLSDWQEFEVFQYQILDDALGFEDHCRRDLANMTKWEVTTEQSPISSAAHDAIGPWLRPFNYSQEEIEAAKKQLKWIQDQWPKAVAEAIQSVSMAPELRSGLEAKFRKQTHATFNAIQKLGGRPSHAVSPPDESMDDLQRLLQWSSETSKYMEELLDWKAFLAWRRRELGEKSTAQEEEYQCPQFQSVSEFSAQFESFRHFEHSIALAWLRCWQRVVRWYEEEIETPGWYVDEFATTPPDGPPEFLYDRLKAARSHLKDSEQKLADAATRLEKSRQEHGQSIDGENAIECPQNQSLPMPSLPGSASLHSSQSSSSSSSQSSFGVPSPQSSHSSQPSQSSHFPSFPKSPQPPGHVSEDRKPPGKGSSAEKLYRRSKKKNTRKKGTNISTVNIEQQALPTFALESQNVEEGVDIQMTDAPISPDSVETTEKYWGSESEDKVMTDPEDPLNHISTTPSQPPIINTKSQKSPSPSQGPTRRKTGSATKLDQAAPSRVLKNTKKKPAKKAKKFTEQQAMLLLNAASHKDPDTNGPPLRRSERLKEKAAMSPATTAAPQLNAVPSPQSSQKEQPQEEPGFIEPSQSLQQEQPEEKPSLIEHPQPLQQEQAQEKHSPINKHSHSSQQDQPQEEPSLIEPSHSSQQDQTQEGPNPLNRPPKSSKQKKKPKIQHHLLEPSQNPRRMRKKKRRMQLKASELFQT